MVPGFKMTKAEALARYKLAKAWRDYRNGRIDGHALSIIINQCAAAIHADDRG
jgi:hypothetical protein